MRWAALVGGVAAAWRLFRWCGLHMLRELLAPQSAMAGDPSFAQRYPLLGEHTTEVLSDWLGLDAAVVAQLRQDGIV
jgi:hypothetical protein